MALMEYLISLPQGGDGGSRKDMAMKRPYDELTILWFLNRDRAPFVLTSDMAYVINGGEKPTIRFQLFVDLCCQAYNLIRKHASLFLNLLSLVIIFHIQLKLDRSVMLGCIKNYDFYAAEIHNVGFFLKPETSDLLFGKLYLESFKLFYCYLFLENLKLIHYHKSHWKEFLTTCSSAEMVNNF